MDFSQVAVHDTDNRIRVQSPTGIPQSPPPSFRSQVSSRRSSRDDATHSAEEQDLDNAFDAPSDDDDADDTAGRNDQQRLISHNSTSAFNEAGSTERPSEPERRNTDIPNFASAAPSGRVMGGGSQANDGVWANISAKPQAGEDVDEKPPVRTLITTATRSLLTCYVADLRASRG